MNRNIMNVSYDEFMRLLDSWINHFEVSKNLYLADIEQENIWLAADNSTGDFWVEEFKTREEAMAWLRREDND